MNDALPTMLEAPPALPVKVEVVDGRLAPELMDGETRAMWVSRLKDALGTESDDLAWYAVLTMFKACRSPEAIKLNAMIEQVRAGHPNDPQEMVLMIQMAACAQRLQEAIIADVRTQTAEERLMQAKIIKEYGKLYARQMESLHRYRRDGSQTINVVHFARAENVAVRTG